MVSEVTWVSEGMCHAVLGRRGIRNPPREDGLLQRQDQKTPGKHILDHPDGIRYAPEALCFMLAMIYSVSIEGNPPNRRPARLSLNNISEQ